MSKITENDIELLAIDELENLGWSYIHGPEIAPDGERPERQSWDETVLVERLRNAIASINPEVPHHLQEQALKEVTRIASPELITNNEYLHTLLTDGVELSYHQDGQERGVKVWLIDFEQPENNDFLVVNQFTVIENNNNKRPDIILFVNGLPLVVIELKNAADENATVRKAFDQLETYKATIPALFAYNEICIISDGLDARAGSLSAGYSRYMSWKTADGKTEADPRIGQMETLIKGLLNRHTLLDYIRHFVVFEKSKREDLKTGIITIETVKKIAAYHQYYAVNKAVESTQVATSLQGNRKGGVVWHTQGSGKSLSMVFFSGKLVLGLDNPTLVVITDRNDLDDQLFDTFAASSGLLRQVPVQAESRDHLKELLKVASGGIVFTTIQKFLPENLEDEEGNKIKGKRKETFEELSERRNIVVIADEAHRTQYGFKARNIDDLDPETGEVIGTKTVYGFAKYMRDALPNATYIGFTGTPIENTDVNTPAVFGNYIDIYDIAQAVEDGATVWIYYESRLAKVNLTEEGKRLVEELDKELESEEATQVQKAKAKWSKLEALIGSPQRVANVAQDIIAHFEERQKVFEGKAMIVAMSRRIAVDLYHEIIKIRPEWHQDDLDKGGIKVVMTAASSDGPRLALHHTTKTQRKALSERMKDPDDPLKLVIVRDMWLTGFDAPCLHTLYIDKPMKGHNLMQAIARVNRVYKDKPGGLVVDYLGIASDLKKALSFYSDSGGKGDPAEAQEIAVDYLLEKLEVVSQMFDERPPKQQEPAYGMAAEPFIRYSKEGHFPYENYFTASTSEKLSIILAAEEHILSLEDGKSRFIREVTALSKALAIAIPNEQAMAVKEEVGFFQAVKARLVKFEITGNGKSDHDIETAIKQVVDEAIVSDQVVDIFDAAGIKKPDISILSEDFLEEIRGMNHQNLALELLKKLLNDEIKVRAKRNMVQSRTLMEMLEGSIKRYQNKVLTAAEVIQELIKLAKDIKDADRRGEELGLSEDELAFYDALEVNDSAVKVLGDDTLRDIARELVEKVRNNASIDWTIKESVRAKLRVLVKRTLRKYGYPPDKQVRATETVLKQAELMAGEWK
jgi:type I restriction enzyme R subunit